MLGAQPGQEIIDVVLGEAQNSGCPKFSAGSGEAFLSAKELSQYSAVGFYNLTSAFADTVKIFQCYDTQQFGRMRRDGGEQVVQSPHGPSQVGLGQNPPTAKAAQAVDLGQTGGNDELRSQVI